MFKKLALYITIALSTTGIISCNSDSDDTQEVTSTTSAIVTSFSLAENDDILENLDSVYFSIDLDNALIYNADSLPYGTKINRLVVKIGNDGCAVATLHVPGSNGASETTVDYLTNSTDSIDFSNGPVTLHLVSVDYSTQRDYKIYVNVHKMEPDSLYWNRVSRSTLPTEFSIPTEQKTVLFNGQALCLTGNGNAQYSIGTSSNPGDTDWDITLVTFPFTPDVNSLAATDDALYILDTDGILYTSTDMSTWQSCGTTWNHIYGGYGSTLLGNTKDGDSYTFVTYPETITRNIGTDFPVSGTSQLITINTKWNATPQAVMLGGRCSDGRLSGDTWGYDGSEWAKISTSPIAGRENMALCEYQTFKTDTDNWTVTQYPTWIAMGGTDQNGTAVKDVYISLDQGIHWKLADDLMQLPSYIPEMSGSQALVFESTINSAKSRGWKEYASKTLPSWWGIEYSPRITELPTQWECPYIYLFGGYATNGRLYNTVWKGVINRLTFRPLL